MEMRPYVQPAWFGFLGVTLSCACVSWCGYRDVVTQYHAVASLNGRRNSADTGAASTAERWRLRHAVNGDGQGPLISGPQITRMWPVSHSTRYANTVSLAVLFSVGREITYSVPCQFVHSNLGDSYRFAKRLMRHWVLLVPLWATSRKKKN